MSQKILTVFGATGNQGGSVIKTVLGDKALASQFKIRGITRDTTKPAARALAERGVEVISVRKTPLHVSYGPNDLHGR